MAELVLYVVIFIALYFQVFALLTYVSKDARLRRERRFVGHCPSVAIIVPCFNEEQTIRETVESLQTLEYPKDKLQIILVNDGSTDGTRAVMDSFAATPGIRVVHKQNGGKHSALNTGISMTDAEFIGCLDADSFVHPDALKEIVPHFKDERVAAVTASMAVHNPQNPLERMQYAEYLMGIALRHILSAVNGLYVTPGPFSFYRRSVLVEQRGFRHGHQTEDMEMALRLQKAGYWIENAPRAKVYTKAPSTLWGLLKQRTRWTSGFIRNAYEYRSMIGNPRYGVLGLLVLPLGVLAVVAGIGMFTVTLLDAGRMVAQAAAVQGDVPLSFSFSMPPLDWYFMPITGVLVLSLLAIVVIVLTMELGRRVSGVHGAGTGSLWYILIYSFIAPLWLIRSTRDVLVGINRSWR